MSQEVVEITHNQLKEFVDRTYEVNEPLMVWGTTGIGKSETVLETAKEIAQNEGREFEHWNELKPDEQDAIVESPEDKFVLFDIRLAGMKPEDVNGIPDISEIYVEMKAMKWAHALQQDGIKGIVFLDEVNLAHPNIQKAFYQLVQDGQISGSAITDGIGIIGAGNRAEDRAQTYEMAGPLRARFAAHVNLMIPTGGEHGSWTKWALDEDGGADVVDDRITAFIAAPTGSDKLFTFTDGNRDATVFATPRTWVKASKMIEGVEDLRTVERFVAGAVGQGVASEFRAFLELRETVDLNEILKNPEKVKELDNAENAVDLKYSVLSGLAAEYKNKTGVLDNLVKVATHLDTEFGTLLLRLSKSHHPRHFEKHMMENEDFDDHIENMAKYF